MRKPKLSNLDLVRFELRRAKESINCSPQRTIAIIDDAVGALERQLKGEFPPLYEWFRKELFDHAKTVGGSHDAF